MAFAGQPIQDAYFLCLSQHGLRCHLNRRCCPVAQRSYRPKAVTSAWLRQLYMHPAAVPSSLSTDLPQAGHRSLALPQRHVQNSPCKRCAACAWTGSRRGRGSTTHAACSRWQRRRSQSQLRGYRRWKTGAAAAAAAGLGGATEAGGWPAFPFALGYPTAAAARIAKGHAACSRLVIRCAGRSLFRKSSDE